LCKDIIDTLPHSHLLYFVGGFSDMYQAINTQVGSQYAISYDVWATPLKNTAKKGYCQSTDSNGLLAITEGAIKMGCDGLNGFCGQADVNLCPDEKRPGQWQTVTGTYTAHALETTFRL
jgi:hypothetical protein